LVRVSSWRVEADKTEQVHHFSETQRMWKNIVEKIHTLIQFFTALENNLDQGLSIMGVFLTVTHIHCSIIKLIKPFLLIQKKENERGKYCNHSIEFHFWAGNSTCWLTWPQVEHEPVLQMFKWTKTICILITQPLQSSKNRNTSVYNYNIFHSEINIMYNIHIYVSKTNTLSM
jgi:hypothetical protein